MDYLALPGLIDELATQWPRRYRADTVQIIEVANRPMESDIILWQTDPVILIARTQEIVGHLIIRSFRHYKLNGATALWWA